MRIKGPSGGVPPVDETSEAGATTPSSAVDGAPGATEVSGAGQVASGDLVSEVARRLRAGELTPREAVELLIDDAVGRQVGKVTTDRAALATELKDLLRRYSETDPYLASKVRRLGNK